MSENLSRAERLRARLAQDKAKSEKPTGKSGGDNASYQFWNLKIGQDAKLRFLPDGDQNNDFFWVKREVVKLPFEGIVGGENPTEGNALVTVPCMDMFDGKGSCPIIAAMKPYWKDKEDPANADRVALARLYYKKVSYLFQGFVKASPLVEENPPENPIRRFVISPQLFGVIEPVVADPEMVDLPCDYQGGCDFTIKVTAQGKWNNYSTSSFSRNTRRLDETEMTAIETHGLFNLSDYRGAKPGTEEIEVIKAMFEDSLAGKPFDFASYGKYYRAYEARSNGGDQDAISSTQSKPVRTSVPEARTQARVENVVTESPVASEPASEVAGGNTKAADIIAKIRQRQQTPGK